LVTQPDKNTSDTLNNITNTLLIFICILLSFYLSISSCIFAKNLPNINYYFDDFKKFTSVL
jgi:hypothetical protein